MVLDDANVRGEARDRIWGAVVGQKEVLGQEEVWCLLALVGLAGLDGEEVNIDAVDERRNSEFPVYVIGTAGTDETRSAGPEIAGVGAKGDPVCPLR